MGLSLSWLAVEPARADATLARLGLERTEEPADLGHSPFVGGAIPGGWYLLAAPRCDHLVISDAILGAISADGTEVLACSIEEHVSYASASLWRGGARRWRVVHEGDRGARDLTVEGEPPRDLEAIRREHAAKQDEDGDGVDWFVEIPLVLAQRIAGFKHDEDLPGGADVALVVLRVAAGSPLARARPWWRPW